MSGLLPAGWQPGEISLCVRRQEQVEQLSATGCVVVTDPVAALEGRQAVVVAVKPADVPVLLEALAGKVGLEHTVISLAAGVTTSTYEERLGEVPVVRAMPNTPALVGEGVTGIASGAHSGSRPPRDRGPGPRRGGLGPDHGGVPLRCGHCRVRHRPCLCVPPCRGPDRGRGPGGVAPGHRRGFRSPDDSGCRASPHRTPGETPAELRSQVTSPGGTTAAAMHVLEERGFRALVEDAVRAAAKRSSELGGAS